MQQASSHQSLVPNGEHTCRCQQVAIQSFDFRKGSDQWIVSPLAMLKAEKAGVFQIPQTLCEEDSLVADAAVWWLPGILSLPRIMLPVPIRSQKEPSIKQLLPWKNKHLPLFNVLPVLPIDRTCVQHSSSHQSPVGNREHTCQAVIIVREPFSSQFPFSQRVRSMNSVSFAMLKAVKAGVSQTPQTLCWEERFVSDAAVATSYQESHCLFQFRARMSGAVNNFCRAGGTNICPK